uniref:Uncharacterized protein n=1 Tax=Rhizophora mucronata TaxID=61149 RepID=A0A2P2NNU4_RHIMU
MKYSYNCANKSSKIFDNTIVFLTLATALKMHAYKKNW